MTGAKALVETLIAEGTTCVFGIPGAQQNEIWDVMKSLGLDYVLVTHEFSAAAMADGSARATGRPGVLCIVPGPGVCNALTGLGEALLDSVPVVAIVGDVANGCKAKPFQVHSLPQAALLQPVTKEVLSVEHLGEIPCTVRRAFQLATCGEPGPVAVVIPYNLLIESQHFHSEPLPPPALPFDEDAFQQAVSLLSRTRCRVGIYAGFGCMDYTPSLARLAETLQAPVATSVSGKGVISDHHPLAVGWGYGPQGTITAEEIFKHAQIILALGVRFSEVSTGVYADPQHASLIQVDANPENLGRVMRTRICVHADAGVFMDRLLEYSSQIGRAEDCSLQSRIRQLKCEETKVHERPYAVCGADAMAFLLALRRCACPDALVFVDAAMCEHWAAEAFKVFQPRTYFNNTDNQALGWAIPAAIGAQRAYPDRQTIALAGDGGMLMSGLEMTTAARDGLPVKFLILDNQAYVYMQKLQKQAYHRTTATRLAHIDYEAFAKGLGLCYQEILTTDSAEPVLQSAFQTPGPVLVRVATDYGERPVRWIEAAKKQFEKELTTEQKVRYAARLGVRSLKRHELND
jgi:acetolactate synthase-1/2/3 large subunit